jgi:hypothetical protein
MYFIWIQWEHETDFWTYDLRLWQWWLWRMLSSGMWRCVDLALTDVSEERITSIFRVEKSARGEPAWAGGCRHTHTGSPLTDFYTPKMEAISSSETLVNARSTQRYIPEDNILHRLPNDRTKMETQNWFVSMSHLHMQCELYKINNNRDTVRWWSLYVCICQLTMFSVCVLPPPPPTIVRQTRFNWSREMQCCTYLVLERIHWIVIFVI